jgi:hypothetical protein
MEATTSSPPGSRITTIDMTAPSSIEATTPVSWFLALICTPERSAEAVDTSAASGDATPKRRALHN